FTRWPDDPALRYGRAATDLDPVTDKGARLNIYRHRLVFVQAGAPLEELPPSVRPLMGLLEDTLDGHVGETRYPDAVYQHILARIRVEGLTPEENAKLKDEAGWEAAKREERQWGHAEGRAEGRAEEAARNLLTVLGVRGIAVPDTARERILAQKDAE